MKTIKITSNNTSLIAVSENGHDFTYTVDGVINDIQTADSINCFNQYITKISDMKACSRTGFKSAEDILEEFVVVNI